MNAPICMFCKHCERMSLKNRRVTYIRRCTKHNTVVVSTTKECKDYEKGVELADTVIEAEGETDA